MKHIPANEGNYGFRPIQCPNYYAKGTSFSKTSNSMLYVHTTMPHIVTLDAQIDSMKTSIPLEVF